MSDKEITARDVSAWLNSNKTKVAIVLLDHVVVPANAVWDMREDSVLMEVKPTTEPTPAIAPALSRDRAQAIQNIIPDFVYDAIKERLFADLKKLGIGLVEAREQVQHMATAEQNEAAFAEKPTYSQYEIAKILGISRSRVYQVEGRAMRKLRRAAQQEAAAAGMTVREWLLGEIE